MGTGFRTSPSGGVAAPPYTNGPYTFSEVITFEDDVTIEGDFTVGGSMTFGDSATDNLVVKGDLRINDDRSLHFGTDEDVSLEYDEDGDDELKITGNDWRFADDLKVKFGTDGDAWIEYDEDGNDVLSFGGADLLVEDDLKLYFGSNKDAYIYYDETTNDVLEISGSSNGIWLSKAGGAIAANMVLLGAGTTASPATTSSADKNFLEFRTESTATSGDSRCLYMRHALNGAGVSGEALRAFGKVTAAAATCRGAHISLDLSSAGSCSGLGAGVDSQLMVFDGALSGGSYAALQSEIYSVGSSTDISGATEVSFLRFSNNGDATGLANVEDNAFLMVLNGGSIASGNIVQTETDETKFSHKIKVKMCGTTMYLMACDS